MVGTLPKTMPTPTTMDPPVTTEHTLPESLEAPTTPIAVLVQASTWSLSAYSATEAKANLNGLSKPFNGFTKTKTVLKTQSPPSIFRLVPTGMQRILQNGQFWKTNLRNSKPTDYSSASPQETHSNHSVKPASATPQSANTSFPLPVTMPKDKLVISLKETKEYWSRRVSYCEAPHRIICFLVLPPTTLSDQLEPACRRPMSQEPALCCDRQTSSWVSKTSPKTCSINSSWTPQIRSMTR